MADVELRGKKVWEIGFDMLKDTVKFKDSSLSSRPESYHSHQNFDIRDQVAREQANVRQ